MTTDRLDAIFERLDEVLERTDDTEVRQDVREVQQLVIGVKSDLEDGGRADRESDLSADRPGARDGEPADED